jgi:hypothetical protein
VRFDVPGSLGREESLDELNDRRLPEARHQRGFSVMTGKNLQEAIRWPGDERRSVFVEEVGIDSPS